jgi:hypothetical protein
MLLSEWESKQLLGTDLPRPREILSSTVAEAVGFARGLRGPVVCKASGVGHKTEGGLVRLGLDADGVASEWDELAAGGDGHVLVAEQLAGELELIAGGLRDPQFGPLVSIGLGGIAAEIMGDVAFLLAPPEPGELDRAIDRLRGSALFDGYRGRPPVDRAALGRIVGAIARLLDGNASVVEVDCNPILVVGGAPVVADALVVTR